MTGTGLPFAAAIAETLPHRSAIAVSIGKSRPWKRDGRSTCSQDSSRPRRCPERRRCTPFLISPSVSTLRNRIDSSVSSIQRRTWSSGSGLINSKMTLVSSRKPVTALWLFRNRAADPVEHPNQRAANPRRTGRGSLDAPWPWTGVRNPRPEAPLPPICRAWLPAAAQIPAPDGTTSLKRAFASCSCQSFRPA